MNHESDTVTKSQVDRLATIWAIVEARQSFPATIVVTRATADDDTQSIARGLAQVAHDSGQRTSFLQLPQNGRANGLAAEPYAVLSFAPRRQQREAFDAAYSSWRSMYDVVIIDAATLDSGGLAAHAARIASGVVIGVCEKRRIVPADRELARLLKELRASVIGVVMTGPISAAPNFGLLRDRSRLEAVTQQ